MPYSDRHITLVRVGRIVTACAYITLTSNFTQVSNVSVNETIPEGFRPSTNSTLIDSICIAPNLGATCNRHADS